MAKSRDAARVVPSSSPCTLMVRDATGDGYRRARAAEVLSAAETVLQGRIRNADVMSTPAVVRDYLRVRLGALEYEVFAVLMLDVRNAVIEYVELFRGTVCQTSVYPREVVKETLARNAAGVILVHNHPSGSPEPSKADEFLTQTLKSALSLVDVRVLDHLVVTSGAVVSFAERGVL